MLTAGVASGAQLRDWLTNNDSRNGSTVVDFLAAVERTDEGATLSRRTQAAEGQRRPRICAGDSRLSAEERHRRGDLGATACAWRVGCRYRDPRLVRSERRLGRARDYRRRQRNPGPVRQRDDPDPRQRGARRHRAPNRVVACGYDWRRDIRAGARDLKRCIETAPELKGIEALIVIAHSMGGLVTATSGIETTRWTAAAGRGARDRDSDAGLAACRLLRDRAYDFEGLRAADRERSPFG